MNEILSKVSSNVISTILIILLFGASFVYLFGGDDSSTQEHLDRVADNNEQAGAEINRVITNIEHAGETVTQLESGVNRGKELISKLQDDNRRAKQILGRLIDGDQEAGTQR